MTDVAILAAKWGLRLVLVGSCAAVLALTLRGAL
jgi:hypothetical protein